MPTYIYWCPKCNEKREEFFKTFSIAEEFEKGGGRLCTKCDTKLERVPSVPGRPVIK